MKRAGSSRLASDDPWRAVELAKAERGVLLAAWLRRLVRGLTAPIGIGRVLIIRRTTGVPRSGQVVSVLDEQRPRM